MAIQEIMCVVDHSEESERGFRYAIKLAHQHEANLIAFYPVPELPPTLNMARQFDIVWLEKVVEELELKSQQLSIKYIDIARELGLEIEWQTQRGIQNKLVAQHSKLVDLVVLSQENNEELFVGTNESAGDFLISSNTPAVFLPSIGSHSPPKKILIAWDESQTATRAIKESIPFLHTASAVHVVSISEEPHRSIGDLIIYLGRHNVTAKAYELSSNRFNELAVLLNYIGQSNFDQLVMGAYGHSRVRESILGGMTKGVLTVMPIPTFMVH